MKCHMSYAITSSFTEITFHPESSNLPFTNIIRSFLAGATQKILINRITIKIV